MVLLTAKGRFWKEQVERHYSANESHEGVCVGAHTVVHPADMERQIWVSAVAAYGIMGGLNNGGLSDTR